jgi:hypothetical protein
VVYLKSSVVVLSALWDMQKRVPEFEEVLIAKSKDLFLIALKILMPGPEELQLAIESPSNLLVDLEEIASVHKVNSLKVLLAIMMEILASNVDCFLTSLTVVPISIIYRNLQLAEEDPFIKHHINNFGLESLVIIGSNEFETLGLVCSSLMILTNIAHKTPQRPDLM